MVMFRLEDSGVSLMEVRRRGTMDRERVGGGYYSVSSEVELVAAGEKSC